jgi:hypothetical protein
LTIQEQGGDYIQVLQSSLSEKLPIHRGFFSLNYFIPTLFDVIRNHRFCDL